MIRNVAVASIWLSVVPACGLFSSRSPEPVGSPGSSEVSLEVESHNWSDIVIYLRRGNASQRLGMVTAQSTAHFFFPYRHLETGGNTRLYAYPIGGPRGFTSEDLLVQPGQSIKWTLESDLSRSFLGVY